VYEDEIAKYRTGLKALSSAPRVEASSLRC
jgi:hypothetical protein